MKPCPLVLLAIIVSISIACQSSNPVTPSASWAPANNGLADTLIYDLAETGSNLFAGGWGHGVSRSTDGGKNWIVTNAGLHPYVSSLTSIGQTLFAGTPLGVFLSSDNGTTWSNVCADWSFKYIDALASAGMNLYAGNEKGVFVTTNNGANWTAINIGLPTSYEARVTSLAFSDPNLYAGTLGAGLFVLKSGQTTWTSLGVTNKLVDDIVTSGTSLFIATRGSGVLRSTNQGATWDSVSVGLANLTVNSLVAVGTDLFAGVYQSGIFHSSNNGNSWVQANDGLPLVSVACLIVHKNTLYAATYGKGVWCRPL